MVKKFLLHLQKTVEWQLVAKTCILGASLFFVWISGGSFFSLLLFAALLTYAFLHESEERNILKYSYIILGILSMLGITLLEGNGVAACIVLLIFLTAYLVWVGIVRFFFRDRELAHGLFNLLLLFGAALCMMGMPWSAVSFVLYGVLFVLIFMEFFSISKILWYRRALIISIGISFILLEISLAIRLLPLGFVNAAAFFSLSALLLRDMARAHFRGILDREFVVRTAGIFLVISVIIFASSIWRI